MSTATVHWLRNYGAMKDDKLLRCVAEFQRGYGDAVNRVNQRNGSLDDNRAKCEYEARRRGLIDTNFMPAEGAQVFTEAKFCPECERKKPFHLDDYICRDCRGDS